METRDDALAAEREVAALLDDFGAEQADALSALLARPERGAREAVRTVLGGLGPAALAVVLPAVLPLLGDRREESTAGRVLDAIGPAAVPALLAIRADGPGRLRRHALHALARLGAGEQLSDRDRAALRRLVDVKLLDEAVPEDGEWDLHWLAVPGGAYRAAYEPLGLHDPVPATLRMGESGRTDDEAFLTGPDGTERSVHRVFVTPELAGWRLFFGSTLMRCYDGELLTRVAEACGEAHFYYRDGYEDQHHWAIAERGRGVVRSYDTYAEPAWTGEPLPWETPQTEDPLWAPGEYPANASLESDAQGVAARISFDPEELDRDTPRRGHGWFLLTEPGAGHGIFPGALTI